MKLPATAFAVVLFGACSLSGCAATGPQPQWVTSEVSCPSEQVIYEFLLLSLERSGFPPSGMDADPAGRKLASGWKTSLAPFKGKGWRERASVEYDRIGAGRYEVSVRVEREINEDVLRPLDPSFAQWKPTEDNVEHAQHVITFLRSFIGGELELDQVPRDPGGVP